MKVFIANRLENLVDALAGQLEKPPAQALTPETIVVQSAGMAKWISLTLASRHGVAANYQFPFPNAFVDEIFSAFIPEYTKNSFFDEGVLVWRILDLLPELAKMDEFLIIRNYLGDGHDQKKLYQLACKIARTFDQYLIFRPEMILQWEKGVVGSPDEEWQTVIWRNIVETQGTMHKAALRRKLIDAMQNKPCRPELLPERLSVFGIAYLPPYHLDILVGLSAHMPVNYYYLNPSREFWADIRSGQEISRVMRKIPDGRPDLNDHALHLESGNSLLASWGVQGRDFFRLMENMPVDYQDLFEEISRDSLLQNVQSDIYRLREPHEENGIKERLSREDDSIQIHACYSPLREVETLHDVLLDLFDKPGVISPKDVLVMTPDIETYAPWIEAVFEAREPRIPYSITDRSPLTANLIACGLMSILDIVESRFKAGDVLALLENPAISEKFDITNEHRELLNHWIDQTFIKWGIDEEHRRSFGLPSFGQNTWRHGLDRLLAGVVFDGRRQEIFEGILPYGEIESEQTSVLGQFLTFWEKLVDLRNILCAAHLPGKWCEILKSVLADFFLSSDDYRSERYLINQTLGRLYNEQAQSACRLPVELGVIRSYLREALVRPGGGARFLEGGVSFCEMLPMRSIPFAVICLMGMNSDAYPRRDGKTGFNVMENDRRAGDRSLRSDDQYLFLESILSARKNLIISYVGLSQTDNSAMLPSVLVSDFMDYMDRNYTFDNSRPLSEAILRSHRLHAFSPEYFGHEKRLFSYSGSNYLSACAIVDAKDAKKLFLNAPLTGTETLEKVIPIQNLMRFYMDPVRYFLEHRLGLKLPDSLWTEAPDSEPFSLDPLSKYGIKQNLVQNRIKSEDDQALFRQKRAEGALPVGAVGDYLFNDVRMNASAFAKDIAQYLKSPPLEKLAVTLPVDENELCGTLDNLHNDYRISYRPAKLKMKDYLNAWISHVILNAAAPDGYPKESLLLGEDGYWRFESVPHAKETLKVLIQYFRLGQARPLKLFARSSWEYAAALWQKNKTPETALDAARSAWESDENSRMQADADEIACKICFEDKSPIDEEFSKTADDILKELFAHMKKAE